MKKSLKGREAFVKSHLIRIVDESETCSSAAKSLGVSKRTVERWVKNFKENGQDISFLKHGNSGKAPINKNDPKLDKDIISIYRKEYMGQGFTVSLFWSQLKSEHGINVPLIHVWRLLKKNGIEMAGAHKAKDNMIPHPLRPRRSKLGEMLQVDACTDFWLPIKEKVTIHGAIDDCTNEVVGLCFDRGETQNGYFRMFYAIGKEYGTPKTVYTDNRKGFMKEGDEGRENLRRDLSELGVKVINTSVPQAKGRIERLWHTLLSRLKPILWHKNIDTIDKANAFLPEFRKDFNSMFRVVSLESVKDAFTEVKDLEWLRMTLTARFTRKANQGNAFSISKKWVQLVDDKGTVIPVRPGTVVEFRKDYDDVIYGKFHRHYYRIKEAALVRPDVSPKRKKRALRSGYGKKDRTERRGRPKKSK